MELLGRGGGGEVVKARNRLDRQLYAIKKIKMSTTDKMKKKIFREVKTISRLQHRHIVRYCQAWLDGAEDDEASEDEEDHWADSASEVEDDDWLGRSSTSHPRHIPFLRSSSYEEANGNESESDLEWAAMAQAVSTQAASITEIEPAWDWAVDTSVHHVENFEERTMRPETLYIQMEYCESNSLREVIDSGELYQDTDNVWRLFRQIVEAIEYIHGEVINT